MAIGFGSVVLRVRIVFVIEFDFYVLLKFIVRGSGFLEFFWLFIGKYVRR